MRGVKWIKEREEAIKLRKQGFSIVEIEKKLGINRSTLSGWLKDVKLASKQKVRLMKHWRQGLWIARKKAIKWHNAEKAKRLNSARLQAEDVLKKIDIKNKDILDFGLAMLYLGEGFKTRERTGMGNSDPLILKAFLFILRNNYNMPDEKLYCSLHLRADQNGTAMKKYWSKELQIPINKFKHVHFDKRTIGSKTFPNYHGVCSIQCSPVAIQRKLLNISRYFCERLLVRA